MPHKSKKEKETKPGKSKRSGGKNGPADDQDGSNKKVPPATQVMRVKQPGSHSAMKREKRFSTSSFPLSENRELQKLPALAGMPPSIYSISIRSYSSFLQMQLHYIFLLCSNSYTRVVVLKTGFGLETTF
ncbi:serine/threonine-protein phosphatase 2A 56 kDa regulatory subunit delta isoform-like [Sebastes umbrosus]|uniref:serine/threonine-protein phosphatase 2A 56 kDa regulatory subunit delta isoform-like n=1 Tax=Sebastes umbrosus TaxID=72105 RepID=UPI00189F8397|nr:serine/threonine-protein phosphatase 2A 56 kDa regulatory subunit delta isoform-like [Sebastes umbrosus]